MLHVPGEADANAGDRQYLVLAKPNVIMNDIRDSEGWRLQKVTLPVGRVHTTTPRPLGTSRATKGRKRAYADWLRDFYRSQLRGIRRQDRRAKLGRYTAGRG